MRFPFLVALATTIALAGTVWYQNTKTICPVPITYKVNQIDSHFNLSLEQAKTHVAAAEAVWEASAGRDLFTYDENADLIIDFVFDDRQAKADSEMSQKEALDKKQEENDALRNTINDLQKEYEADASVYERAVDAYERDLTAYNAKVQSYNDQGGAPAEAFNQLEAEKQSLNQTSAELDATEARLNELGGKINQLGATSNKLIDEYNRDVALYNEQFGFTEEFTQGDYTDGVINIYKFSNERELVAVLTHELGHALGIDHVEGESSVMYYLLAESDSTPVLSAEDTEAFTAVCGAEESFQGQIRHIIRTTLKALNF